MYRSNASSKRITQAAFPLFRFPRLESPDWVSWPRVNRFWHLFGPGAVLNKDLNILTGHEVELRDFGFSLFPIRVTTYREYSGTWERPRGQGSRVVDSYGQGCWDEQVGIPESSTSSKDVSNPTSLICISFRPPIKF